MSPRKLTDSDKQEIITLYRNSPETTSTLAKRYEVSSSTISRFLKSNLPESEYESLIQEKRLSRTAGSGTTATQTTSTPKKIASTPKKEKAQTEAKLLKALRTPEESSPKKAPPSPKLTLTQKKNLKFFEIEEESDEENENETDVKALEELLGEELGDLDEDDDDLEDDDDWDEEDDDSSDSSSHIDIHVLPLSEALFPRPCYLVIDRAAELITRPLKDFGDLGEISPEEVQQRTLPVFDNHRVARRFSNRSQRVIKVPDGRLLQKTSSYLQDKGITRLLIDGQVYTL